VRSQIGSGWTGDHLPFCLKPPRSPKKHPAILVRVETKALRWSLPGYPQNRPCEAEQPKNKTPRWNRISERAYQLWMEPQSAVCGSGVGASVCANKVRGVRAGLIHDHFSARQGVEDDHMNLICMGGRVMGPAVARELVDTFLAAEFSRAERHLRRLRKVSALEAMAVERVGPQGDQAHSGGRMTHEEQRLETSRRQGALEPRGPAR
jgi:hypothetical protein